MRWHLFITWFAVTAILTLVAACARLPTPDLSTSPTPTLTSTLAPTMTPTVALPGTSTASPTPTLIDLVWWTPVWFSPQSQDAAGDILAQHVAAFEETHPNVRVQIMVKAPYGQGGIKDYLQQAHKVAPALLPDVVALDMADLPVLTDLGLFQSLEGLLGDDLTADLYPFAQRAGTREGHWLAVQFEADFQHLVYYRDTVSTPPATWDALLNSDVTYLMPLFDTENEVSEAVLLQYAASGGELGLTEPAPLNEQALVSLFNFYDQALRRDLLPQAALAPQGMDAVWVAFQNHEVALANVTARRYLREGLARVDMDAAPIPTWDGKPFTLTHGWGLAITTADPRRQEAARVFLTWLLDQDFLSRWTQATGFIPSRRSALQTWETPESYVRLLDLLLQRGKPYPAHPAVLPLRRALAVGLKAMLQDGVAPETAVRQAQEAYTP